MSVSADRNKEKFIRATIAALNMTSSDTVWRGFGYKDRPHVFKKDIDMFTRLFLFEVTLAHTIGRDQKVLKLLKKEEFRHIAQKMIDYKRISAVDCADIIIAQIQYYIHDDMFCLQEYASCTGENPPVQWRKGALCALYVVQSYLKPWFERGNKVAPDDIDRWTQGVEILSIDQFMHMAEDQGVPKDIRDNIKKLMDEIERQADDGELGVLKVATTEIGKAREREERES